MGLAVPVAMPRRSTIRGLARLPGLPFAYGLRLGASPWTTLRGGMSCHNQIQADGRPGAAAVDLVPVGLDDLAQRAAFYQALGRAAHAEGLRWGGDFQQRNAVWARHGLGWDPAHIEDHALCVALRAGGGR